ncbi:hypothetical protein B0H14DRAFT_1394142 [Mycena olivaceomarginata]|nr:hypothetical protein B0H14DRAFT_1394142 [Mycena olivaceomarginata]
MRAPERLKVSTPRSCRRFRDSKALGVSLRPAAVPRSPECAMIPRSSRLKSLEDKYGALHRLWSTHCSSLDKELGQSARKTRIPRPREVQDNSAVIPNMECLTLPRPTLPNQGVNLGSSLAGRDTELIEDAPAYYASRLQWSGLEIGSFWKAFAGAKKDFSAIAIAFANVPLEFGAMADAEMFFHDRFIWRGSPFLVLVSNPM